VGEGTESDNCLTTGERLGTFTAVPFGQSHLHIHIHTPGEVMFKLLLKSKAQKKKQLRSFNPIRCVVPPPPGVGLGSPLSDCQAITPLTSVRISPSCRRLDGGGEVPNNSSPPPESAQPPPGRAEAGRIRTKKIPTTKKGGQAGARPPPAVEPVRRQG